MAISHVPASNERAADERLRDAAEDRLHGEEEGAGVGGEEAPPGPQLRPQDSQPVEGDAVINPPPGSEYTQRSKVQG